MATTLSTKRLGLLKQLLPKLHRVAMLWNKDDLGMSLRYDASAKAAEAIGVAVQAVGVREPDDFNEAFAAMDREPPDAILMVSTHSPSSTASACSTMPPCTGCRRSTSTTRWFTRAA